MGPEPNRRQFFRHGLQSILNPLADLLEAHGTMSVTLPESLLRPPGALPETDFLNTCRRSGDCVRACPAAAIRLLPSTDPQLGGTPVVDPNLAACVICDELACMRVCPSGALQLVDSPADIRMGLAHVRVEACLRTQGEDCAECVERCPLGSTAIRIGWSGSIEVQSAGCVGCGVCQLYCPTRPRAIVVQPH